MWCLVTWPAVKGVQKGPGNVFSLTRMIYRTPFEKKTKFCCFFKVNALYGCVIAGIPTVISLGPWARRVNVAHSKLLANCLHFITCTSTMTALLV